MSSPAKAGDPVLQRRRRSSREAAAYWIARSRLRRGFTGPTEDALGRRSFSRGGKPGDDSLLLLRRLRLRLGLQRLRVEADIEDVAVARSALRRRIDEIVGHQRKRNAGILR